MLCRNVTAHLTGYLAGTLPDAARDELRAHLAVCESCRAEVDETDELWQLLGALPAAPADSDGMRTRFEAVLSGTSKAPGTTTARAGGNRVRPFGRHGCRLQRGRRRWPCRQPHSSWSASPPADGACPRLGPTPSTGSCAVSCVTCARWSRCRCSGSSRPATG